MSHLYRPSSPIKEGRHPPEALTAAQTYDDLREQKLPTDIVGEEFLLAYLSGGTLNPPSWSTDEEQYVSQIRRVKRDEGESLYTDDAPLLRLLNSISKQAFQSINFNNIERDVLVFYSAHDRKVHNPFSKQHRKPDIIALWDRFQEFPEIDYSQDHLNEMTWCAIAVAGEFKNSKSNDGRYQLSNYLQNHLQLHPELNAVLGLTFTPEGYALFYHDADVIHRSGFDWGQYGPLYAFVEKLYTRPFQDASMQIVGEKGQHPAWVTKINDDVYISEAPQAIAGPGQRRYTTVVLNVSNSETVFLKDIWRDNGRLFYEALLFEQAHKDHPLPGLMRVDAHGFVLDATGELVKTTGNQPGSSTGQASGRSKMRILTKDIGRPLDKVDSLVQFLSVMYDACAVQRNLYRKCRILHRDISDGNIMIAPETGEYRKRCAGGFASVRFLNQVLAKDKNCEPAPACLVIDLGNGADLKITRNASLRERTGTPRFIARSVSSGMLLNKREYASSAADMPSMKGLGEYGQFMHSEEYQFLSGLDPDAEPDTKSVHQLFHDAESTFWVIAWTLSRSASPSSRAERDPHISFREFFHIMFRHFPIPQRDSRSKLCERSEEYWESVLHPDLRELSGMLTEMFEYIRPEWAYRPDLDPEHVHEALMRLMLAEIVRLKDSGKDIPLAIGGRAIPALPPDMALTGPMNSLSIQISTSISRPPISLEPHRDNSTGAKADKSDPSTNPADSRSAETQTPDPTQQTQDPQPGATQQEPAKPTARDQLRARGKSLVWAPGIGRLRAPELQIPESPVPEQDVPTEDS